MNYVDLKNKLINHELDEQLKKINCCEDASEEINRYSSLLDEAYKLYGDGDYHFISSPGRSEIGGNHTDHQHGHVVAASLNMDNVGVVKVNNDNVIRFSDPLFTIKEVCLDDLNKKEEEINTSESLIRGIAFRLKELGYNVGGFDCLCNSRVLAGSGISSSACFEVMLVEIFNALYNEDKIENVLRAQIGQWAENNYFGKPCGLLDQLAISCGGFVCADFFNPEKPVIENFDFSFSDYGYELCLVNTKGDHKDLSDEYAAVTREIKEVANCLNVNYLADSNKNALLNSLKEIREKVKNDRGVLRSLHFYNEDERAVKQKEAIRNKDINELLRLMKESGRSSYMYLQNVYPASRPDSQSLAVALCLTDMFLNDIGAYRVHGGGFEGTIQVVLPKEKLPAYRDMISQVFGDDALLAVRVRPVGTMMVI